MSILILLVVLVLFALLVSKLGRGRSFWMSKALAALVLLVGAVGLFILAVPRGSGPRGGLTIRATPGTKIYLGDQLIGTGEAFRSWPELIDLENGERHTGQLPAIWKSVTAETLGGAGTQQLHRKISGSAELMPSRAISMTQWEFLLRRADGRLDQVFVTYLSWAPKAFVLPPIRLRKEGTESCFGNEGSGISSWPKSPQMRDLVGYSVDAHLHFQEAKPPAEIAEEIRDKGLWEPGGEEKAGR